MREYTYRWVVYRRHKNNKTKTRTCRTKAEAIAFAQLWANKYRCNTAVVLQYWVYSTDKAKYVWQDMEHWSHEPDEWGSLRQEKLL